MLNLDVDYRHYLDTLAADGLNYTRIFTGAYVELPLTHLVGRATREGGSTRTFDAPPYEVDIALRLWRQGADPGSSMEVPRARRP